MIDTIKIQIDGEAYTTVKHFFLTGEYEKITEDTEKINIQGVVKKAFFNNKKDTNKEYYKGFVYLNSRNYGIRFFINENLRKINIEWSVPKWEYSSNVFEFIDVIDINTLTIIDHLPRLKEMLGLHLYNILNQISYGNYYKFIGCFSLVRIDLCKNIIFNSEHDSTLFYKYLTQQKKKYSKTIDGNLNFYKDETIFYKQDAYSVKFYKKGKELTSENFLHDMKTNLAIAEFANRIIRFEVTYRNLKLSQIMRQLLIDDKPDHLPLEKWKNKIYRFGFDQECNMYKYDFFKCLIVFVDHFNKEFESWLPKDNFNKSEFNLKIDEYAYRNYLISGKKCKVGRFKLICQLIEKGDSWDKLVSDGIIPKSSSYYYKNKFHQMGININRLTYQPVNVDKTYFTYMKELRTNQYFYHLIKKL